MQRFPFLAPLVLVFFGLAGCVGQGEGRGAPTEQPTGFDDTTGAIEGIVYDESFLPVADAQVGILELEGVVTTTDQEGLFSFGRLPPGTYQVAAQKIGFGAATKRVEVVAGQATTVELSLAQITAKGPFHVTKDQRGLFGCGLSWRPAVMYSGVSACGVLSSEPINQTQYDKFLLTWKLTGNVSEWDGVVYEMQWTSNQLFGKGLAMIWEVDECYNERDSRFGRAQGPSPLKIMLNADQIDEKLQNNTKGECEDKENCNDDKCDQVSRVFSNPDTLGTTSPSDIGFTYQQQFHQFMTEFYNEEPDPGFTALADA